jgi:hypothetical protein
MKQFAGPPQSVARFEQICLPNADALLYTPEILRTCSCAYMTRWMVILDKLKSVMRASTLYDNVRIALTCQ